MKTRSDQCAPHLQEIGLRLRQNKNLQEVANPNCRYQQQDYESALRAYEEGLELFTRCGNQWGVHAAPLTVPTLLFPDESVTVVPEPSLNPYAATSPAGCGGGLNVVALATSEYPLTFPAASAARTR